VASVIVGILFLAALFNIWLSQKQLSRLQEQLAALKATSAQIDTIRTEMAEASARESRDFSNVNAILARTVGKYIPIEIPPETDAKIRDLQQKLLSAETSPKDIAQVAAFREQLRAIVLSLPPWAEEDLLPRLDVLRWSVDAVAGLESMRAAKPEQMDNIASDLQALLDKMPEDAKEAKVPPWLRNELEEKRAQAELQGKAFEREQALKVGRESVAGNGDPTTAIARLQSVTLKPVDKDCHDLIAQLRAKLFNDTVAARLRSIEAIYATTPNLKPDALRQSSLARVYDSLHQLLIEMKADDDPLDNGLEERARSLLDKCESDLKASAQATQDERAKKLRQYQGWALDHIDSFNAAYEGIEGRVRWYESWKEEDYADVAKSMVRVGISHVTAAPGTAASRK
jgi:type II secretory pathway pseudopilin PulG